MTAGSRKDFFLPPLIEDEFLVGYRGRLAVLNNCPSRASLYARLQREYPSERTAEGLSNFVFNLARAHNVAPVDLLRLHTVWPLICAFPKAPDDGYQDSYTTVWLKLARTQLAMCPACIDRDLANAGVAIWRRTHQIPGLLICPEHGEPLLLTDPPEFLRGSPDRFMSEARRASDVALSASRTNPVASRTVEILTALCGAARSALRDEVSALLRKSILDYTKTESLIDAVPEMGRRIKAAVPSEWLMHLLPNADLDRTSFVGNLVIRKMDLSCASVACILAVTHDDAAAVIRLLLGQQGRTNGTEGDDRQRSVAFRQHSGSQNLLVP